MDAINTSQDLAPSPAMITDDARAILGFAYETKMKGMACALATLVEIRGGAARALGAQMAIRADGSYCGYVSGGCVEAAVAAEAVAAIQEGHDRTVAYGLGSTYFDIAMPCGGGISVAIQLVRDPEPLGNVVNCIEMRLPVTLALCPQRDMRVVAEAPAATRWHGRSFLRRYEPNIQIALSGGTIETMATSRMAREAGYAVLALDRSDPGLAALSCADRFTAIVLLHHDVDREIRMLEAALESDAFYIGALGSTKSHQNRCHLLRKAGVSQVAIERIKAPIGLFPRARDSRTLALSVLADIAASRSADTP